MRTLEQRFPRYSRLLRLYPAKYQTEYTEQMLQTLADMLDDAPDRAHKSSIWMRTAVDFPVTLARQQIHYIGGIMTHETPTFVKQGTLASSALLLPFLVIVLADVLTSHRLNRSFLWHSDVLVIWIIVLPALALLVSVAAYIAWVRKQSGGFWHNFFDLKHSWPMVVVGILSLGILGFVVGHDSVHCVTGNPYREFHNPSQTLHCIEQR